MSVHEDTLLGLQEALDYAKGNKAKGHLMTVAIADDELDLSQTMIRDFSKLSMPNQQKAILYINELLQASNE